MTDIHCHILHNIDDGAGNLDEAVRLCRLAVENSIDKIIVTPHLADANSIESFVVRRQKRMDELRAVLDRMKIEVEIYPGSELFVDDEIFFSGSLEGASLNGSRYMLIEFGFRGLSGDRVMRYVSEIRRRGYVPIIAHPERYEYMQNDYNIVNFLAENGVLMQINSLSLTGALGKEEFELAHAMVTNSLASFIASDAHSHDRRPNDIRSQSMYFPQDIPMNSMERLLIDNPACVLSDSDIPRVPTHPIRRKSRFLR